MPIYDAAARILEPDLSGSGTFATHPVFLIARDAKTQLTPNETQRTTLIVAGCYILAIAILWCVYKDILGRQKLIEVFDHPNIDWQACTIPIVHQ